MTNERPDYLVLSTDDLDQPALGLEARAEKIADVLEAGKPSRLFLTILADMIRPSGKKSPYVLELRHPREGRPKGPNWRLGYEMVRLVDNEDMKVEAAIEFIRQRFGKKGHSRATCLEALMVARRDIQTVQWFQKSVMNNGPEND